MRWTVRRGPSKKACFYATFDLQDLIACKFSHRWTCLYVNICMSPNFLCSISTISASEVAVAAWGALQVLYTFAYALCLSCFHTNASSTRRVHARVHRIKHGYLHTFWLTKTCLRIKFNISHRVLHLTSHWYTWNDVKPHDFKLTNHSQNATFEIRNHIWKH